MDEDFPYVSDLSFGEFTLYTKKEIQVSVFCGSETKEPVSLLGLSRLSIRRDCRLIHADFTLEPTVDFSAQDYVLTEIPLTFVEDENLTKTLNAL